MSWMLILGALLVAGLIAASKTKQGEAAIELAVIGSKDIVTQLAAGLAEVIVAPGKEPGKIKYPDGTVKNGGPASWRANNPGNITYSDEAVRYGAFPGVKLPWGKISFAVFPNEAAGFAALLKLLKNKWYGPLTIAKAMERYLGWVDGKPPAGSVDNPAAYAEGIATAIGKPLSTVVNALSLEELTRMAKKIQAIEGWTAAGPDGKPGTISRA